MKRALILCIYTAVSFASQYQIQSVKVTGEKSAEIQFTGQGNLPLPTYRIQDGTIEFTFMGGEIAESAMGKLELDSPHALVRRISVYSPEKDTVRAKVVLNGSTEGLKGRFNLSRTSEGIKASIDYPKAESATLELLKEEQQPINVNKSDLKKEGGKMPFVQFGLVVGLLLIAGGASYFFVKALKSKGVLKGTRKYLVEQLGYVSLGNKTGVSLIKVGREFVLVGVTPNQVTLLSTLPKLENQYDEESQFERGVFREAMVEEVERIGRTNA